MYPLLFMTTKARCTLIVSISKLPVSESLSTPSPVIMAGSVVAVFPLIVIYFVLQPFQVTGLQVGAVKVRTPDTCRVRFTPAGVVDALAAV